MFVKAIDLGNTHFELVIVPLKGTALPGRWDEDTDLFLVVLPQQQTRAGIFGIGDFPSRFTEKLGLGSYDARNLAEWFANDFQPDDSREKISFEGY